MTTIGVGVVAVDENQRILLGWRIKEPDRPCWSLPGGHIEPGETPQAAAVRELVEETGLVADTAQPIVMIVDEWAGSCRVTIGVLVTLASPTPVPQTCEPLVLSGWEWHTDPAEPLFAASGHVLDSWFQRPSRAVARFHLTAEIS